MSQDDIEVHVRRGQRTAGSMRTLLSVSTLRRLPGTLSLLRKFMDLANWNALHTEIQDELKRNVAIVGLPNAGKSTLFNTLRGQRLSAVSDQEGTTTTLIRGAFGPFILIDTPGHLPDMQRAGVEESSVVVLLLDATRGIRQDERTLLRDLRRTEKPLVVALNKVDALRGDPDDVAGELAARLAVEDIIPISARDGSNVAEELVPALMAASPDAALSIGLALPTFRREAAMRIVRNASLISLAAGLEPIPLLDIPILLGNQIRMVLRIGALYGEPMDAKHTRELMTTIVGGLALRYLAEEAAKAVPIGGDVIAGAIAAGGTWALGQVAVEYFENDKQFSRKQIKELFMRYYRRYREERLDQELAAATAQATGAAPATARAASSSGVLPGEAAGASDAAGPTAASLRSIGAQRA